jgi:hypothetical protein
LLFCNGSGLTLRDIRPLLDPLTASFDLLAWDYRGFGRSAPVTHPYTMADAGADSAGLLEIAAELGAELTLTKGRRYEPRYRLASKSQSVQQGEPGQARQPVSAGLGREEG